MRPQEEPGVREKGLHLPAEGTLSLASGPSDCYRFDESGVVAGAVCGSSGIALAPVAPGAGVAVAGAVGAASDFSSTERGAR